MDAPLIVAVDGAHLSGRMGYAYVASATVYGTGHGPHTYGVDPDPELLAIEAAIEQIPHRPLILQTDSQQYLEHLTATAPAGVTGEKVKSGEGPLLHAAAHLLAVLGRLDLLPADPDARVPLYDEMLAAPDPHTLSRTVIKVLLGLTRAAGVEDEHRALADGIVAAAGQKKLPPSAS